MLSRTLALSDIIIETPAKMLVKIGRVAASGVGHPAPGRVSVSRMEIAELDVGGVVDLGSAGNRDAGLRRG